MRRRSKYVAPERKPVAPVKATITAIHPSHKYMEGIVERTAAEIVEIRAEDGRVHQFATGSIQTVPIHLRKVGQQGFIRWIDNPSMFIAYFTDKETG